MMLVCVCVGVCTSICQDGDLYTVSSVERYSWCMVTHTLGAHTLGVKFDSQLNSSRSNHYSCCHCVPLVLTFEAQWMLLFHQGGTLYWYYGHLSALQTNKEPEYSLISGKLLPPAVEHGLCVHVCVSVDQRAHC